MNRTKNDTGSNNNQPCFEQLVTMSQKNMGLTKTRALLLLLQQWTRIGTLKYSVCTAYQHGQISSLPYPDLLKTVHKIMVFGN